MSDQQTIKETLNVIRKALEDEDSSNSQELEDNVLVLNKLVKDDGTINIIDDSYIKKNDVNHIFKKKLDEIFEDHFDKWLDKKIPNYLEKYFKNKKF